MQETHNKKYAIKSALKSMLGLLLLILFLLFLGNSILPSEITHYFWNYGWMIFFYILYSGYRNYKGLNEYLDDSVAIEMIKKKYKFPIAKFKEIICRSQVFQSILEKRIDILKFFSPIPLLLYGIGVYVDDKVFLKKSSVIFGETISYKNFMIYGGFIAFAIYLVWIYSVLGKHKQISLKIARYQSELFFYEELLLSDEKPRRKDHEETIRTTIS